MTSNKTHTCNASHWINYIRIRANNGVFCIIILNLACSKEITFKPLTAIRSSFISLPNGSCFFVEKFFSNILRCSLWNSVSTNFERHSLISSKTPVKKVTFLLNNTLKSFNDIILPKLQAYNFVFSVQPKIVTTDKQFQIQCYAKISTHHS